MFTPLTNYLIDSKKLPVHYVQDGIEECAKLAFTMHKK